jgi:hypothetical protein
MEAAESIERIKQFDAEVLAPLTERFAERAKRRDLPTEESFARFVFPVLTGAIQRFLTAFGGPDIVNADPLLSSMGIFFVARRLNDALPRDCPYCIGFFVKQEEELYRYRVFERSTDSELNRALSEGHVPVLYLTNKMLMFMPGRTGILSGIPPPSTS